MGVIAKYKFNNTLEANLLPEFNSEFTSDLYTVTDEVSGEVTTRTIESESLPTLMRFGRVWVNGESTTDSRTDSLLEVLDMNTSGLINCHSMFRYCTNLTSITCEWNTSNVTNMHSIFDICYSLTTLDTSNFNTSNVTDMGSMFYDCTNLTSLDVSNFNTSNVTNMNYMFQNCTKLTTLNVSNFNTSNVTTVSSMFHNCNNLTSLDVSNFNTSNVTNMQSMFYGCTNLTSLDVSNWDTNNVTNMYAMFSNCNNLTSLDVNNWDTSGLINAPELFYNCSKLTSLNLSKWNTSNVIGMGYMFGSCSSLTTLDVSNFDTSKATTMTDILSSTNNLKHLKCNNINTLNKLNTHLPTKTSDNPGTIVCKSDTTNLDVTTLQSKNWNILDEPTLIAKYVFDKSIHNNCIPAFNSEFEGYFIEDEVEEGNNEVIRTIESCGILPTLMRFGRNSIANSLLKILDMNTSQITNMHYMFRTCINLISIKCNWNTSKVTTMNNMFCNCNKLIYLDTFNWDTSNVTDMNGIFFGCNVLEKIDISNWDISKVTRLNYAFANQVKTINLSNCNCEKVTDFSYAFAYNKKIILLNISGLNISNMSVTTDMFVTTPNLKDIIMLNCNLSTIQKVASLLPTTYTQTIWHNLSKADEELYQAVKGVELKRHEENKVEVKLNSPLLEGDEVVVKDGKLCHYHKMGMVVLDGSEDEPWMFSYTFKNGIKRFRTNNSKSFIALNSKCICNNFWFDDKLTQHGDALACSLTEISHPIYEFQANLSESLSNSIGNDVNKFCKWLQQNPTTVIYELAEPYYEDITNLQSAPTLKTYLECSMEIDTDLPIDTNITYRTNLSSVYVMERELDELDNGTDLGDILEGEVNE